MICPSCGANLPKNLKFCPNCGFKIEGIAGNAAVDNQVTEPVVSEAESVATASEDVVKEQEAVAVDPVAEDDFTEYLIGGKYTVRFSSAMVAIQDLYRDFVLMGTVTSRDFYDVLVATKELNSVDGLKDTVEIMNFIIAKLKEEAEIFVDHTLVLLAQYGIITVGRREIWTHLYDQLKHSAIVGQSVADARDIQAYIGQTGIDPLSINKFINDRIAQHDYRAEGYTLMYELTTNWLPRYVTSILVSRGCIQEIDLRPDSGLSAQDKALYDQGSYDKNQAMQQLANCLASTLNTTEIFLYMIKIAPECAAEILWLADLQGRSLDLAMRLWNPIPFINIEDRLPQWFNKHRSSFSNHEAVCVTDPFQIHLLYYLLTYYPKGYPLKVIIVANDIACPIYPSLQGLTYFGLGQHANALVFSDSYVNFQEQDIHTHNLPFIEPYKGLVDARLGEINTRVAQILGTSDLDLLPEDMAETEEGSKKLDEALQLLVEGCELQDFHCMVQAGIVYRLLSNHEQEGFWLQEAMDFGYEEAQWPYTCYLGSTADTEVFLQHLNALIARGHGKAIFKMGALYESSSIFEDGVNYFTAGDYYRKAEALGVPGATEAIQRVAEKAKTPEFRNLLFKLYQKYHSDIKTEDILYFSSWPEDKKDRYNKSMKYLRDAVGLGHEQAKETLININLEIAEYVMSCYESVAQMPDGNLRFIISLLEEAVNYDSVEAKGLLAYMKFYGYGMEKDEATAESWFREAAACGITDACLWVAEFDANRGDWDSAFGLYKTAAMQGAPKAEFGMGQCYEKGLGTDADVDFSLKWYKKALEHELADAKPAVIRMSIRRGDACLDKEQFEEALQCYEEAGELGSVLGMVKAASERSNSSHEALFDYGKAMDWYHWAFAAQPGDASENDLLDAYRLRSILKMNMPLRDRVAYFAQRYKAVNDNSHYYWGTGIPDNRFENAMENYASQLGAEQKPIVVLCDSTNATLWGKGKEGFLISDDGILFSSRLTSSMALNQIDAVQFDTVNNVLYTSTGLILARFESSDVSEEDVNFALRLCEDVLVSASERSAALIPARNRAQKQPGGDPSLDVASLMTPVQQSMPQVGIVSQPIPSVTPQPQVVPTPQPQVAPTPQAQVVPTPQSQAAPQPQATSGPKFCFNCGTPTTPGSVFCGNCGTRLVSNVQPAGTATTAPMQWQNAPQQVPPQVASNTDFGQQVELFAQQLGVKIGMNPDHVYCKPNIPMKKLINVLESYGSPCGLQPDDILILADTTIRGTARDGFIVTRTHIISSETGPYTWSQLTRIDPSTTIWGGKIKAQPMGASIVICGPHDEFTAFCEGINQLLKQRR